MAVCSKATTINTYLKNIYKNSRSASGSEIALAKKTVFFAALRVKTAVAYRKKYIKDFF